MHHCIDPSREVPSKTFDIKNVGAVRAELIAETDETIVLFLNSIFDQTHSSVLDRLVWTRSGAGLGQIRSGLNLDKARSCKVFLIFLSLL